MMSNSDFSHDMDRLEIDQRSPTIYTLESSGKYSLNQPSNPSDILFTDVSLTEQELASGGLSLFDDLDELDVIFKRVDTSTFGDNDFSFNGITNRSRTGFNQSEFTVGFNARRGNKTGGYNNSFGRGGFLSFLYMLARSMFF